MPHSFLVLYVCKTATQSIFFTLQVRLCVVGTWTLPKSVQTTLNAVSEWILCRHRPKTDAAALLTAFTVQAEQTSCYALVVVVLTCSPWEKPPGLWRPCGGPLPGRRWCPQLHFLQHIGSGSVCTAELWARWRRQCHCSLTGSPSSPRPHSAPHPFSSAARYSCQPQTSRNIIIATISFVVLQKEKQYKREQQQQKKTSLYNIKKSGGSLTTSWSSLETISSSFWCPFFRSSSVRFRASSSAWALSISSFILQRSLSLTAEIRDARMVSSPMVPSLLGP